MLIILETHQDWSATHLSCPYYFWKAKSNKNELKPDDICFQLEGLKEFVSKQYISEILETLIADTNEQTINTF